MILYELKKILVKQSNQIALLLLACLVAITCRSAIRSVEWIDSQGNLEIGQKAASQLRLAQNEWSGTLDIDLLNKALTEIKRLDSTPEYLSADYTQNRIAQGWRQGIQEIRWLLCSSFAEDYQTFDERDACQVSSEELEQFYENRATLLSNWLYDKNEDGYFLFSDSEKQYLIDQYTSLKTPFEMDYAQGWMQATEHVTDILIYGVIIVSFLLAGIFSDEFRWKADAVYYTSIYGRSRGTGAKIGAGFILTSVVYWFCTGSFSLIVLGSLGFDGGACVIQSNVRYWKSMYNLTFYQKYLLILIMGYLAFLFFGFLVMWVSAKSKSPVFAVMIPPVAIMLPKLLSNLNISNSQTKLITLMPDRLLDGNNTMKSMILFSFGDKVMKPVPVLISIYLLLTIIWIVLCYSEYRKKHIC